MQILVVEDSVRMARVIKKGLEEESFSVFVAPDGSEGLRRAQTGDYDLVLLDINLPGIDGFTFLRRIRESRSDVPVMMVTARDSVEDRVAGLDGGADDYIVKPFEFEEFLARIRAVMRRPGSRTGSLLQFEDITLDPSTGRAMRGSRQLFLSAREFALLQTFLSRVNEVVPRSRLYTRVWGIDYDGGSNVLEVYVRYLRNKLEEGGAKRVIHTVRGRGYLLGKPQISG